MKIRVTLEGGDYLRALNKAHIYLLPSLGERALVTMIEAMAASCIPIAGTCGGAAMLMTQDCGRLISITTPNQMALEIAAEIKTLWTSPGLLEKLGSAAVERVASRCSESFYREQINAHYKSISGRN